MGVKNRKWRVGIIVLIIFSLLIASGLVAYPGIKKYLHEKENQKKAQAVVKMLDDLEKKKITVDSESELKKIQKAYDSLNKKQKKLVPNYSLLKKAYKKLEAEKDQAAANEIILAIDSIDINALDAADLSVANLRENYESLTEKQKKLVTNINKLTEYEQIVQTKKNEEAAQKAKEQEEQSQRNKIMETFAHLQEYDGWWGEFGAHVNPYQGMVESAINSSITMGEYFGDLDHVYMELRIVVYNDDALTNGPTATNRCYWIHFEGSSVTGTGGGRELYCTVYSPDGIHMIVDKSSLEYDAAY